MEAGGAEEGCEAGGGGKVRVPGRAERALEGRGLRMAGPWGAGLLCGLGSRGGVCGSAPPLRVRLCLLFAGSTGAASTFFLGCECGAGSGGEGAAISWGHERVLVSEDGWWGSSGAPARPHVIVGSPYSSAHPREQKLEPLRGLMSCLSSGLRPAPQRSGRGLLCRTPTSAAQTAGALKI